MFYAFSQVLHILSHFTFTRISESRVVLLILFYKNCGMERLIDKNLKQLRKFHHREMLALRAVVTLGFSKKEKRGLKQALQ